MPRGDGTGPAGQGPMTGRGAGYCAGYDVPGFANPAVTRTGRLSTLGAIGRWAAGTLPRLGLGLGRRLGRGRGQGAGRGMGRGRNRSY